MLRISSKIMREESNTFCILGVTADFTKSRSIKIPKWVGNIVISYSCYPGLADLSSVYDYMVFGIRTYNFMGYPPKKNIKLASVLLPSSYGYTYASMTHTTVTNINSEFLSLECIRSEDTLIYDGMDNDYFYYHTEGSTVSMHDNILEITGQKKKLD